MDYFARIGSLNHARGLYAQARDAMAAQEETAAITFMNTAVGILSDMDQDPPDSETLAEYLETDIGTLEAFREELNAAAVRQAFMNAVKATDPAKAMLYLSAIEECHRVFADDDTDFDEFCHETGIDNREFNALKADVLTRQQRSAEWRSGGAKFVSAVAAAALRPAFKWAAGHASSSPAAALNVLRFIEWTQRKIDGTDKKDFYSRTGIDGNLIAKVRGQIAPQA